MKWPLLQVRDLKVRFGEQEVVRGVNFSLSMGERLALVGQSGSGKSVCALSLVKLLDGAQVQGRVLWTPHDEVPQTDEAFEAPQTLDLVKLSDKELVSIRGDDIAFVFQEPMTALNPVFTIGDQIAKRGPRRWRYWPTPVFPSPKFASTVIRISSREANGNGR
jgi:microcin C transport system ATP-binding protein